MLVGLHVVELGPEGSHFVLNGGLDGLSGRGEVVVVVEGGLLRLIVALGA